eukprot:CAMPEP_0194371954 /NCGR_PEP_ID=MMETSP0174-20130528/20282_1 /TAXON_ID=216777 /ORGANISM="Proboscia alata, Strain PI-D3" /LENGTH=1077 /DNA_ID=CAMNT_0039150205 /DNA_START=116 /DNA_END=3349 /DNA_ORIENTATION=-
MNNNYDADNYNTYCMCRGGNMMLERIINQSSNININHRKQQMSPRENSTNHDDFTAQQEQITARPFYREKSNTADTQSYSASSEFSFRQDDKHRNYRSSHWKRTMAMVFVTIIVQSSTNRVQAFNAWKKNSRSATTLKSSRPFFRQSIFMSSSSNNESSLKTASSTGAITDLRSPSSKMAVSSAQQVRNKFKPANYPKKKKRRSEAQLKKYKIRTLFKRAQKFERSGRWSTACQSYRYILTLEPTDAHTYLALGRLESKRKEPLESDEEDAASKVFREGTNHCPQNIHLLHGWAIHEMNRCRYDVARDLFERALALDGQFTNDVVCHAYGLMESNLGFKQKARDLWERALKKTPTAALITSLGQLESSLGNVKAARNLYARNIHRPFHEERERTEVYLAAAWLEEREFGNMQGAVTLLGAALRKCNDYSDDEGAKGSRSSNRILVALARLEERIAQKTNNVANRKQSGSILKHGGGDGSRDSLMRKRLMDACSRIETNRNKQQQHVPAGMRTSDYENDVAGDGRMYNAWANLEFKAGRPTEACRILKRAISQFPNDSYILHAAGKMDERIGNYEGARILYGKSLRISPSAPALVAYALLELNPNANGTSLANELAHKLDITNCTNAKKEKMGVDLNFETAKRLFNKALLIDPKHGPTYNAYGAALLNRNQISKARKLYERGINANCSDPASVYHGYAKVEIAFGNIDKAIRILRKGLEVVDQAERGGKFGNSCHETKGRDRSKFLFHSLGMLELNSNHVVAAHKVFERGIARHGNSSQLLLGLALCDVRLGNEDSARRFFKRSVQADRRHAHAWQAWGMMEMKGGNYEIAKELFEGGLRNEKRHGALWLTFANMQSRLGKYVSARQLFQDGIEKCTDHVPLYQGWSIMELKLGNYTHAKMLMGEALTLDKTQGSGWLVAATIEKKLGNDGLAGLILKRGVECAPDYVELYIALSEWEIARGRFDEARDILERGLEMDPRHAPLYHSLAELEARVFNLDGLAKLNKRAAEVFNSNALVPPKMSTRALGKKIQMGRAKALKADQLETNLDRSNPNQNTKSSYMDPDSIIESMRSVMDDE